MERPKRFKLVNGSDVTEFDNEFSFGEELVDLVMSNLSVAMEMDTEGDLVTVTLI